MTSARTLNSTVLGIAVFAGRPKSDFFELVGDVGGGSGEAFGAGPAAFELVVGEILNVGPPGVAKGVPFGGSKGCGAGDKNQGGQRASEEFQDALQFKKWRKDSKPGRAID